MINNKIYNRNIHFLVDKINYLYITHFNRRVLFLRLKRTINLVEGFFKKDLNTRGLDILNLRQDGRQPNGFLRFHEEEDLLSGIFQSR